MIVVFDSQCNVCNGFIDFLARHDRGSKLSFVQASSDAGRKWLTLCGQSPDDPSTMIVIDNGIARLRSDAVLSAVMALGGGWRAAGALHLLPRTFRDTLYTQFARRRYRWFGRADSCAVCGNDAGSGK